jgi:hypothetical protein
VSLRRGVGAKGHMPLTARDEVEFPRFPSLRTLKEFMNHRVAAFEGVLMRFSTEAREGSTYSYVSPSSSSPAPDVPYLFPNHDSAGDDRYRGLTFVSLEH